MKKGILCCLALWLAAGAVSAEFELDVSEHRLDNGLTILLLEDHSAPLISYYTFFKVGSRNERPGITGISHFFEHMMFNGAAKYGPKMFDLMLERNGGYSNAYTSKNMTVYYEVFSSDILELVIDLESDRMASLALAPDMLASEIGVVKEERRVSTENSNSGMIYEELFAAAYMAHSYSWPILGWMADLNNINREHCLDYFHTYYAPNNAVVVIAGDFKKTKALDLMKEYFDNIPAGPPPPAVVRNEPLQRGPRRVTIEKPARHPHLMRGYHVGDKDSPDLYALEIIQHILTTGKSCRLHQALVNDLQLVTDIYGGFEWGFDPSLFYFYVAVSPGIDCARAEQALDSVINGLVVDGPSDDELVRAKNSLTAGFYKEFKTTRGTAHQIGRCKSLYGDWHLLYDFVENINRVTADQVRETAARYFHPNGATTAVLIPEGGAL